MKLISVQVLWIVIILKLQVQSNSLMLSLLKRNILNNLRRKHTLVIRNELDYHKRNRDKNGLVEFKIDNFHPLKKQFTYSFNLNYKLPINSKILSKGWLMYYFEEDQKNNKDITAEYKPKSFMKNYEFYNQFKNRKIVNLNRSDNFGEVNIPSENSFYGVLTKSSITILNSRNKRVTKFIDVVNIESIEDVYLPKNSTELDCKRTKKGNIEDESGIEDLGDYIEGFCLKLKTFDLSKRMIWTLCLKSRKEKIDWLNNLFRLVIDHKLSLKEKLTKRFNEVIKSREKDVPDKILKLIIPVPVQIAKTLKPKSSPDDTIDTVKGTWITIEAWSKCTKPCGGGKSYLRRLCLNKSCNGESVLEKTCNNFPC